MLAAQDNTMALLLLLAVLAGAMNPPPVHTLPVPIAGEVQPTVNITFVKEVTLSVTPQDIELTPHEEHEVASFLDSSLRLLDPIMHFFDGLVGWTPPPEHETSHV